MSEAKAAVQAVGDEACCGEALCLMGGWREHYVDRSKVRYERELYISEFVEFARRSGILVLEIGLGLRADHESKESLCLRR
jgi:hypothetical protein